MDAKTPAIKLDLLAISEMATMIKAVRIVFMIKYMTLLFLLLFKFLSIIIGKNEQEKE